MKLSIKIMLCIILSLVAILALFLVQGNFVQGLMRPAYNENKCYDSDGGQAYDVKGTTYGKMLTRDKQTQYTDYCDGGKLIEYYCDGTKVKKEERVCYKCENGVSQKENLIGAVDTLIIVNTDEYQVTEEEIKEMFNNAETYWLLPKTGIKFNLLKVEFFSFNGKNIDTNDPIYGAKMLNNYFHEEKHPIPEYVVIFNNDGVAGINGGYAGGLSCLLVGLNMRNS